MSVVAIVFALASSGSAETLTTTQAAAHVGGDATVCGHVASTKYEHGDRGEIYIDFSRPYPDHDFTALIPAATRIRFEERPEDRR